MASKDHPTPDDMDRILRLAGRPANAPTDISYRPDRTLVDGIRDDLDLRALSKPSLSARLTPSGRDGWDLTGRFGASVTQPCAVTGVPVKTRIDGTFQRRYRRNIDEPDPGSETEMPEDDTLEPLAATVDLGAILAEEIALALPLFPRAPDAELGEAVFTEPGKAPMKDEDTRPFAGLAGLRSKLHQENGNEDD